MNVEEFVNEYLKEHRHDVLLSPYNGLIDFANAVKEELKKEAFDAEVYRYMDPYKKNWTSFLVDVPSENFKDKAKIIVINED